MIAPTISDIGRKVIYEDRSGHVREEGVITSYNEFYVFVRYGHDVTSKGTKRTDLTWCDVSTPGKQATGLFTGNA